MEKRQGGDTANQKPGIEVTKPSPGGDTIQATPDTTPKPKPQAQKKRRFLLNARYDHPPFGGIPMPPGVSFYGFVTTKLTETKPGAGITEKQALAAVKKSLGKDVEVQGLVIESVSVLPEKW